MNKTLKNKESPEKSVESPSKVEKRRRTRNDFLNRNFMCGCGKSYLSYPALYTHLKQKHDKIQPIGTILPNPKFGSRSKNPVKSFYQNNGKLSIIQEKRLQFKYQTRCFK